MSLEKLLDCAGKALEVICGTWSEQSHSKAMQLGIAAEGWKEGAREVVLGVTVGGRKQQGTRLFF